MKSWVRENVDLIAVVVLATLVPFRGSGIPNSDDLTFVLVSNVAECLQHALAPLATLMS